jgi:hypothetical protein
MGSGEVQRIARAVGRQSRLRLVYQLSKIHGEKSRCGFPPCRPPIVVELVASPPRIHEYNDSEESPVIWFHRYRHAVARLLLSRCRRVHSLDQVKRKMPLLQRRGTSNFQFFPSSFSYDEDFFPVHRLMFDAHLELGIRLLQKSFSPFT